MTICIGAVCRDGKKNDKAAVVVASDRMVTMGNLTEFEHEVPKLKELTTHAVALIAGDALRGSRIVVDSAVQIKTSGAANMAQIAELVAGNYSGLRLRQLNDEIFRPRGMNVTEFYQGGQQRLVLQLAIGLDQTVQVFNYGVELLIAGVDSDGAHLSHVGNPGGSYVPFHHTGFGAIGSGNLHAMQSLIGLRHTPHRDLHETVFSVYASKRRAEIAPGVGHDTDMAIVDATGIFRLTPDVLTELSKMFKQFEQPVDPKVLDSVRKLQLTATEPMKEIEKK